MRSLVEGLMQKRRRQRRQSSGVTLTEIMVTVAITTTVAIMVLNMTMASNRLVARHTREKSMEGHARSMLDEALRELRAADQVFISKGINGTNYTTSKTTVVFEAPSYDPASSQGILPGKYDVVAFSFDAQARTMIQSTFVETDSKRPKRNKTILATNVLNIEFAYRVRDLFTGNGLKTTYTLNARASSAPEVFVNGQRVTSGFAYSTSTIPGTITFTLAPAADADIQFSYTVDPTQDNGKWLAYVTGVEVTVVMWQKPKNDAFGTGTVTLSGNARLRNQRT